MRTKDELLSSLESVIPADATLAVVHSSLALLAPASGLDKWTFLRAIQTLADRGMTLVFPAFTFSFTKGKPFDRRSSTSETGVLADWVLGLREAVRTAHPIYSFAVVGPLADDLLNCQSTTTFGDDSTFAYFENCNAQIVMLGCGWDYCTQFHRYEEQAGVPYRFYKEFTGGVVNSDGDEHQGTAKMYVRDLDVDPKNDFQPIVEVLRSNGKIRTASLWRGKIESANCQDIANVSTDLLKTDLWSLVSQPQVTKYRASCLQNAKDNPPVKIAVLGHSNVHVLQERLRDALAAHIVDRVINVFSVPFGQVAQQIIDDRSELLQFRADFTFFVDRPEDLLGVNQLDAADLERADSSLESYLEIIRLFRSKNDGWIIVNAFTSLGVSAYGASDSVGDGVGAVVQGMNDQLRNGLEGQPQLHIFDLGRAAANHSGPVLDPRLWFMGRFPFSDVFASYLSLRYTGLVLSATGRTARVLLIDLDNTLWGGVLGEDGASGVQVGGDYPGNAFSTFQRVLKKLSDRGIGLAVCSKNDEPHAIEAMESISEMAIRPDDLIAHRINWSPKFVNAQEILAELNLGQQSALMIDDNPSEREQMRQFCPGIKVLELPDDPSLYTTALLESPWLESIQLTGEDFKRVEAYQSRAKVEGLKNRFSDLTEFYESLEIQLHFNPLNESNLQRALQLINKTNQFNTTTQRHHRKTLEDFVASGDDVVVIGVEDQFNQFENMGVLVTKWNTPSKSHGSVDTYLLSCRVLGKGIEDAVIEWLKLRAKFKGMTTLLGQIKLTDRNTPVREIYQRAGFEEGKEKGVWWLDLASVDEAMPHWLTIHDHMDKAVT